MTIDEIAFALKPLHPSHSHRPHPRPLPKNIHRHRTQQTSNLNASNHQEHLLGSFALQPMRKEQAEHQAMEDVLAEIKRHQRLPGKLAIRIHAKGDGGGGAEGAAEGDDAKEDGGHDPEISFFG